MKSPRPNTATSEVRRGASDLVQDLALCSGSLLQIDPIGICVAGLWPLFDVDFRGARVGKTSEACVGGSRGRQPLSRGVWWAGAPQGAGLGGRQPPLGRAKVQKHNYKNIIPVRP